MSIFSNVTFRNWKRIRSPQSLKKLCTNLAKLVDFVFVLFFNECCSIMHYSQCFKPPNVTKPNLYGECVVDFDRASKVPHLIASVVGHVVIHILELVLQGLNLRKVAYSVDLHVVSRTRACRSGCQHLAS